MKGKWRLLLVISVFAVFLYIIFTQIFNYVIDPRNYAGVYLNEENRVLKYKSPPSFHGDGHDFDIYAFTSEEMEEILEKIIKRGEWQKYPLNSDVSDLLSVWNSLIENDEAAQEVLSKSKYKEFIPNIENGYYFFIDRSSRETKKSRESKKSKSKMSTRNFSIFLLDEDKNTIYYIALDM